MSQDTENRTMNGARATGYLNLHSACQQHQPGRPRPFSDRRNGSHTGDARADFVSVAHRRLR